MSARPEALRFADELEQSVNNPHLYWQGKAAAELRRQHIRIAELEAECEKYDVAAGMYNMNWMDAKDRIKELEAKLAAYNAVVLPVSVMELIEERDKLKAALDVAQKDAARYRWIRDHDTMNETEGLMYRAHGDKKQIDAEIDERIKEVRK